MIVSIYIIYTYIKLSISLHYTSCFVCFPFHIVIGLFYYFVLFLAVLIRQYHACIIRNALSFNTAYWKKINDSLDKDSLNDLFTRLCCGMLLDNARL